MKKLLISLLFLLCSTAAYSQWTSYPFSLYDETTGAPITGQSANIKFTKYPHSYPDDIITGITVVEEGTQGSYNAKGFTTLQYAKMWISGVARNIPDSILTGNIFTYLNTALGSYITKTTTQSGITGSKTLSAGDWLMTGGTFTFNRPYIYSGSSWVSDISTVSNLGLVWTDLGDSLYGRRNWYYDGTKLRFTSSGYKWYGRTSSTSPFEINTSQFQWNSDKLNLLSTAFNSDSVKHNNLTVGKDSTWVVLGENVTKWRFLTLKKGFWANSSNVPDWKWYYKSFDESGILAAADSFAVINDVVSVDQEISSTLGTTNTKLDSVYITAGTWSIDFGFVFHFSDASLGSAPTIQPDSIIMCATKAGGSVLFDNVTATQQYVDGVNYGRMGTLTWHTNVTVTTPIWIYLNGRRKNTETAFNHTSKHHYISALKVR